MNALDTNVLVRFLVKDDAEQAQQVYSLFKQVENHQQRLFVPILVVLNDLGVAGSLSCGWPGYFSRAE